MSGSFCVSIVFVRAVPNIMFVFCSGRIVGQVVYSYSTELILHFHLTFKYFLATLVTLRGHVYFTLILINL